MEKVRIYQVQFYTWACPKCHHHNKTVLETDSMIIICEECEESFEADLGDAL